MPRTPDDAMAPNASLSPARFGELYAQKPDPWDIAAKWHDRRKFAITVASLPRERYRRCFEPGCANGDLTRMLAQRCDEVIAVDCAAAAVDQARARLMSYPQVHLQTLVLPHQMPGGQFDLIVVSELLYYMSAADRDETVRRTFDVLETNGDLVSVHWRSTDRCYGYDGYNVHASISVTTGVNPIVHYDDENFVLDVFRKPDVA